MRPDVKRDWDWTTPYIPEVFNILRQNASFLVEFEEAPPDVDMKEVGDIVFSSNMGHIAVRIRRPNVDFRDFTIRCRRASGVDTEIHKIRAGFGRWYFYGWADDDRGFKDWILIDLDEFRKCGLATSDRDEKPNNDGPVTWFYIYDDDELMLNNCIVARHNSRLEKPSANHKDWPPIDGWTERMRVQMRFPTSTLEPIEREQAQSGDICCYIRPGQQAMYGIIKQFNNGLVQVGETVWTPVNPHRGSIKFLRATEIQ